MSYHSGRIEVIAQMTGKVGPEELKKYVFNRIGAVDEDVLVGPAYGEDTAAIEIGEEVLVINTDPLIYAAEGIGTLGVNIASNDVVASGARPRWMTVTYLLPDEGGEILDEITRQVDRVARDLGIAIVGGHTELISEINRPFLSLTCLGLTDKYLPTSGAKPGDKILLTKGAGIEGTGILATDFRDELQDKVSSEILDRGVERLEELSVLPEGILLKDYATAMHDPTEGGVVDGLFELASASGRALRVDRSKIVVNADTEKICSIMGVDPLKIFGSGALLATVPSDRAAGVVELVRNRGIQVSVIGEVLESKEPRLEIDDEVYTEPIRDQLYDLWG